MPLTFASVPAACAFALLTSGLAACTGDATRGRPQDAADARPAASDPGASAPTGLLEHPVRVDAEGWNAAVIPYRCGGGTVLEVAYLNLDGGASFAALSFGAGTHLLQARVIASGAAYIALDEQRSYRWRTKGDSGFLAFLPADDHAREEILLRDCGAL